MIPYITYREADNEGILRYYILQKAHPHYVAVISYIPIENKLVGCVAISDYHLYVNFAGTLRGNMIPADKGAIKEIEAVLSDMGSWYFVNRVQPDVKRFKKHKINVPASQR